MEATEEESDDNTSNRNQPIEREVNVSELCSLAKEKRRNEFFWLAKSPWMLFFGILFYSLYMVTVFYIVEDEPFIDKKLLKADITQMVSKGADLDSLKHHLYNFKRIEWGIIYGWNNDKEDYYSNSVSLLTVLKDIKNNYYLSKDTTTVDRELVEALILEYQQTNPFDGLESSQRDQFNNIRIKLDTNFETVEQEIYKLSNELQQKNLLVNQYLSDSKTSLYVSITSLIFALLTTVASQLLFRKKPSNKTINRTENTSVT